MGRSKEWKPEEDKHLAEAWIEVSEDVGSSDMKGTNQDGEAFWNRVYANFVERCPVDKADGIYGGRKASTVKNHWKDYTSKFSRQFNTALSKVYRSNPTGCDEQQKINMAAAIQCRKIDAMAYRFKDFNAMDWQWWEQ